MSKFKLVLLTTVVGCLAALSSTRAFAHTVNVAWRCEGNGDVTFFAATYHQGEVNYYGNFGGIIIDGTTYYFTGVVDPLPGDVDGQQGFCYGNESTVNWQTVTVSGLSSGVHSITTTTTSAVESPWSSSCYPFDADIQCDTTPPIVTCDLATDSLSPPNHDLVDVGLEVTAVDDQDEDVDIVVSVYADEDDEELTGDGAHSPDAKDDGETLRLRAERKGDGDGRVYLIIVTATDDSGNVGHACCTVTVSHSQSKADGNDVADQAAAAELECEITGAPPAGWYLVGDGIEIGPKQ